jgi:predicted signal transduction protein with EAL and GGDEF domain
VIAEGVETQEELSFLQTQECEEAQGYYFSRPLPPEQFIKLLETGIPETMGASTGQAAANSKEATDESDRPVAA